MNKKAQLIEGQLELIPKLAITFIIIIFLVGIIVYYLNEKVDIADFEVNLIYATLTQTENCLALKENNNLLDFKKFENPTLMQNLCNIRKNHAVVIKLFSLDNTLLKSVGFGDSEKIRLMPVCTAKTMPGEQCFAKQSYARYLSLDNQIKPAIIQMEVMRYANEN